MSATILIVDDSADDATLLRLALLSQGADVVILHSIDGEGALQTMSEVPDVDLILLDHYLPRRNALEFLQWIQKEERMPSCPIAVITSDLPQHQKEALVAAGVTIVIAKPTDWSGFLVMARQITALCGESSDAGMSS